MSGSPLHGVVAEFATPEAVTDAARDIHAAGLRRVEAYTPFPIDALDELVAGREVTLPVLIFVCGLLGFAVSLAMQSYGAAVDYPLNIGGRPLNSWPAFGPIVFEITVFWAVAGGFVAWFIVNRLPRLGQRIQAVPGFDRATTDRFFLCVETGDPRFDRDRLLAIFERRNAVRIAECRNDGGTPPRHDPARRAARALRLRQDGEPEEAEPIRELFLVRAPRIARRRRRRAAGCRG